MNFPTIAPTTAVAKPDNDMFNSLQTVRNYPGWISLIQGSSDYAKPPHKMPIGTFAITLDKKPTNIGESFIAVICAWRPCCRVVDKRGGETKINSWYNVNDPIFQEVRKIAEQPGQADSSYLRYFGFEYLYWLPELNRFATHYLNSWSAREAAGKYFHPNLSDLEKGIIKVVQVSAEFKERKQSYYAPAAELIEMDLGENVPDTETFRATYDQFLAPMSEMGASEEVTDGEEL